METNLKSKFKYPTTIVFLSIAAIISGVYGAYLSEYGFLAFPVTSSFLAVLFVFDKRKHIVSIAVSAFILCAEIIIGIQNGVSLSAVFSVLTAAVVAVWYKRGYRKSEAVMIVCTLTVVLFIVLYGIATFKKSGSVSFDEIFNKFNTDFDNMKASLHKELAIIQPSIPDDSEELINEEYISAHFRSMYLTMPAIIIVMAFIVTGFAFKIFSSLVLRLSSNELGIMSWRFMPTSLFAYFYICVAVLSIFATSDELFSVLVVNLNMIFTVVFAYIGYTFSSALITIRSKKPGYSNFLFTIAVIVFYFISVRILAVCGAFAAIMHRRVTKSDDPPTIFKNDNLK